MCARRSARPLRQRGSNGLRRKFRHSLATDLQQHGYDATTIAAVLGHTDPAFTARVYIHAKEAPRFDDLATIEIHGT
jgi:integrase